MKHCLLTFAALLVAASTYAQGTINFVNRIVGVVDAPVSLENGGARLAGADGWVAVLYGGAPGGAMAAVGAPIKFRDGTGIGYWPGEARTIPGVAENGTASLQVKVFNTALGASFEEVQAKGLGGWGQSAVLASVATGGGLNPPTPMTGLAAFTAAPIVPEPSIAALGLLGAGLLLIRRKK
jgi:hypothetical protein